MTGQRAPRHRVSRPAAMRAAAPANTATRQGTPSSTVCTVESPVTTAPPGGAVPRVVEPTPPEATELDELALDEAADTMRAALSDPLAAPAVPTPHRASTTPAARRSTPRVAMTAARQASPARASAPAAGTRSWPLTVIDRDGSGFGASATARGPPLRTAR